MALYPQELFDPREDAMSLLDCLRRERDDEQRQSWAPPFRCGVCVLGGGSR